MIVRVRHGDFTSPEMLADAFDCATQVLVVSARRPRRRQCRHPAEGPDDMTEPYDQELPLFLQH